jgi:hypothetical protein
VTGEGPEYIAGVFADGLARLSEVSAMIPTIAARQPLRYAVESIMRESPCHAPASTT